MDKAIQSAFTVISDINFKAIVDHLQSSIVEMYDGSDFAEYKGEWSYRIKEYAKKSGFEFSKMKASWDDIYLMVIRNLVANKYSWQAISVPVRRASSASGRSSATLRSPNETSSSVSTEASVKQVKLTEEDKSKIKNMYASLEKEKMWRLSTGTFVEEKMMEHAIKQEYEHLSHSLIFHVEDSCWADYFTAAEIDEIKSVNTVELPSLPDTVKAYLDQLEATPKTALYDILNAETFPIESDQKWVQDAYNSCLRLVKSGYFPLRSDVTEQGIGKRMWSCVDTCFDFSTVRCVTGEKCSKASADAANMNRSFSNFDRQQCGRKVDYLLKTKDADVEIGCGECALVGGVHTTKEFQDAYFKMPKVMRDMMIKIVKEAPGLLHKLHMTGLYIADCSLTLWILDAPVGYVSRYYAFSPVQYPITESKIRIGMSTLLSMIFSAKIIMEDCYRAIDLDESKPALGRDRRSVMEPCFVSSAFSSKKRKQ